ncbi:MAG TPA: hypothetical protein VMD05_08650 [Candidatus Nanoarchaeia archaeon]|nr:hypothetical protein [Candidatus Nanoarchaeia archaeon]
MPKEKPTPKGEKHYVNELKEMLKEAKEPKEKVLAVFCQRHGVSMDQCRKYYDELMAKEEIKKK